MSYTESTANLKLPQWHENDYPSWLNDVNGAFRSIDQNAGEQDSSIQQALSEVSEARTLANKASNDVTSLSGEVNSVKSEVGEVRELATAASTTANSAMDVAEIAQDSAEEVAGRTANITTNQNAWVHTVNNESQGSITFDEVKTTLHGRSNTFSLISHGDGNIQSVTAGNVIKFDALNVLARLVALENYTRVNINFDSTTISGSATIQRLGRLVIVNLWGLNNVRVGEHICTVPKALSNASALTDRNTVVYINYGNTIIETLDNINTPQYLTLIYITE